MNLAIGGLLAVIALILYENSRKGASALAPAPGVAAPAPMNPASSASASTPISAAAAPPSIAGLPQFSSADSGSIIDVNATPSFIGGVWGCPGGDVPYYDPTTGTVYCVLPGMTPQVDDGSDSILNQLGI